MKKDFVKSLAQYSNKYVAFGHNRSSILASGATIQELENKLQTIKKEDVVISYIPPVDKVLSPICM